MKPRVGVVVAELGIPSEIWILRQCLEFVAVEPVIFYWKMADNPVPLPPGLETHKFSTPFARPRSLVRRVRRKLGDTAMVLPDAEQRADIRETLLAANLTAVQCHFSWTGLPVSAALDGALPVLWQVHGHDVTTLMEDLAYRRCVAQALPDLDFLAAVGRFQLDLLKPYGLTDRHEVIPCGAPLSVFAQKPLPVRKPGEPLRFVAVGRMVPEKGMMESLRAFEQVAATRPDVEMAFVGDGPVRAELEAAIASSPVGGRIRSLGLQPSEQVAATLSTGHVLLQHSREVGGWVEGFGVTLTEAGAAGLALVASRFGGIVDQVRPGENGFLFEPGDIAAQADYMARLADDEDLRRRMGAQARSIAQTFDSQLMTGRLEQALLRIGQRAA